MTNCKQSLLILSFILSLGATTAHGASTPPPAKELTKADISRRKNQVKAKAKAAVEDLLSEELPKIEKKSCPSEGSPHFSRLPDFEDEILSGLVIDPDDQDEIAAYAKKEARSLKASLEEAKTERTSACEEIQEKKKRTAVANNNNGSGMPSGQTPGGDCAICNAQKNNSPNQSQSEWDGFANVLKAATPLALGGMQLGGNIYGMNKQSSDYRYYNQQNTSLGLPSSPPTSYSGYNSSSIFGMGSGVSGYGTGSSYGMNSSLFGNTGAYQSSNLFGNTGMYSNMGTSMYGMGSYGSSYGYPNTNYGSSYGYPNTSLGYSSGYGAGYGTSYYSSPYPAYGTVSPYSVTSSGVINRQ